jgi:hypothetical protein
MSSVAQLIKSAFRLAGLDLRRAVDRSNEPSSSSRLSDQPDWVNEIIAFVQSYTMTSPERIAAVCQAVVHIERWGVEGDIVECGVWRGGSMMAAALTLLRYKHYRTLHLYDTFDGMPKPTSFDLETASGRSASDLLAAKGTDSAIWAKSPLEEVKYNLSLTAYPQDRVNFIPGKVKNTIPASLPREIALLRLDTDWYESTRHELFHLWRRLATNGILIVDDYGHWAGARKAVDEFIESVGRPLFLNRIDYTGRLIIKP